MNKLTGWVALLALGLATAVSARGVDIDKVNGAIHVGSGEVAGDVSTVNGSIHIEDGGVVEDAETVNGSIEMGDRTQAKSLETVNGGISAGSGAHVSGTVEAVNGAIALGKDADVAGHLSNVNGRIEITGAHVGGGIETVGGDIEIASGARIEHGLLVDKPSHGWFHWGEERKPRIVIGPGAEVQGTLEFRRDVELYISDRARVGTIKGATPVRFSGAHPED